MSLLYLMRHGHASLDAKNDIARPLTPQGKRYVSQIAAELAKQSHPIQQIIYSPAERTRATTKLVNLALDLQPTQYHEEPRIYNAELSQLMTILAELDDNFDSILLIGHNPGLEELIASLSNQLVGLSPGNVVVLEGTSWTSIYSGEATLIRRF